MTHYNGSVPETRRKPDWRDEGLCRNKEPELFFSNLARDEAEAKAICRNCPVRSACAEWSIATVQPYGTWGGMTEKERRKLLRIRVAEGEDKPRRGHRPRAECGTPSAYDRHVKYSEPIDDACRAAHTRAAAEKRERAKPKRKSPEPARCGSNAGYRKHIREKTEICGPCRRAHADADSLLRRTGSTKQLAA